MAGAPPSSVHFSMDDSDLDDAELWAVIDSAAASNSASKYRKPFLAIKNSSSPSPISAPTTSPMPSKQLGRIVRNQYSRVEDVPVFSDGEVVQEEQWNHCRPQKMARFVDRPSSDAKHVVVVRHPQQSPRVSFPSPYSSPEAGRCSVQEIIPVAEISPPQKFGVGENKENVRHSLSGQFPSVSLFKQYQNAAMAILEKSDYTMISGSPFIKKSGWRKISFYFNLSFEIKDKSIEFDDNRNVQRAEFVVRASMQGGRFSDGWGSCERREKKFLKPNHDIPSTAETRAKNKACQDLLGIGEYRPGVGNGLR